MQFVLIFIIRRISALIRVKLMGLYFNILYYLILILYYSVNHDSVIFLNNGNCTIFNIKSYKCEAEINSKFEFLDNLEL